MLGTMYIVPYHRYDLGDSGNITRAYVKGARLTVSMRSSTMYTSLNLSTLGGGSMSTMRMMLGWSNCLNNRISRIMRFATSMSSNADTT